MTASIPILLGNRKSGPNELAPKYGVLARSWKFDLLLLVERFRPKWSLMDTKKYFRYENLSRLPEGPGDKLPTS